MVSGDTKAVIYLTCRLPKESSKRGEGPLSLGEYNRFATILNEHGLRPGRLLETGGIASLPAAVLSSVDPDRLQKLIGRGVEFSIRFAEWEAAGVQILGRSDAGYPRLWKERLRTKCPPFVFAIGNLGLLEKPAVGVVGSRNIDENGSRFAEEIARNAVREGYSVVSGYARGVDQIAMKAALDAEGATIGMVSEGLLRNARNHLENLEEERILFLSTSLPSDNKFIAWKAMDRNKFIYAATEITVVVDSALKSGGTWEGATEALKNNWTRVCVQAGGEPGTGRHGLESLGAIPVNSTDVQLSGWVELSASSKQFVQPEPAEPSSVDSKETTKDVPPRQGSLFDGTN